MLPNRPSSFRRVGFLTLVFSLVLVAAPASARSHNESTPQGLRITITTVDNNSGTVFFDVTMVDRDNSYYTTGNNGKGFLGQRFYVDNYGLTSSRGKYRPYSQAVYETTVLPPALDFGDGMTVPFTQIDFLSATEGPSPRGGGGGVPTVGSGETTFLGSFSHTYSAPGTYTVRAFAPSASSPETTTLTTGYSYAGPATNASNLAGTETRSRNAGDFLGITNTAQVTVDQGQSVLEIPTAGGWGLLLLGLALGVGGLMVLKGR